MLFLGDVDLASIYVKYRYLRSIHLKFIDFEYLVFYSTVVLNFPFFIIFGGLTSELELEKFFFLDWFHFLVRPF